MGSCQTLVPDILTCLAPQMNASPTFRRLKANYWMEHTDADENAQLARLQENRRLAKERFATKMEKVYTHYTFGSIDNPPDDIKEGAALILHFREAALMETTNEIRKHELFLCK